LPAQAVRAILRQTLQVRPVIDDELVTAICATLRIRRDQFRLSWPRAPIRLLPGVEAAAGELTRLAPVVTLSNVSALEAVSLGPHFALPAFRSCDLGFAKPDPRAFETVATAYGTDIGRLVHIGDDWYCDALGAARAGANAIWLSHGRSIPLFPHDGSASRIAVVRDLPEAARYLAATCGQDDACISSRGAE
jgi:FMN phosphatase YigB (HAD superfamily)